MPLTDKTAIEDHTQLRAKPAEKVAKFVPMAESRLRHLVTDATYEDIEGDSNHDDYGTLQRAESLLCLYFGFQFLNLRPTDLGGFIKVIGYGEDNKMMMSSNELRAYKAATYEMAIELLDGIRKVIPEDPDDFEDMDPDMYDAGAFKIG